MNPITCDTAYFGDIAIIMCHVIGQQMPFFDATLLLHSKLAEHFSKYCRNSRTASFCGTWE